jgi:hypothetical protein
MHESMRVNTYCIVVMVGLSRMIQTHSRNDEFVLLGTIKVTPGLYRPVFNPNKTERNKVYYFYKNMLMSYMLPCLARVDYYQTANISPLLIKGTRI